MKLRDWISPTIWGLVIGALVSYAIVAPALGPDPRQWGENVREGNRLAQLAQDQSDFDRLCRSPRP